MNEEIDPSAVYDKPIDLVKAEDLTRAQKVKLLDDWEYMLRQMLVAEEENMNKGPGVSLQDLLDARELLDSDPLDTGVSKT